MTTPMAKLDLLLGYAIAFGLVAMASVLVAVAVSVALGMHVVGSFWLLLLVLTAVDALLGVALGLFASAFARTEFQAIQLMPVVVLPQLLLCGAVLHPRGEMAPVLRWLSDVLPVPYAVEALRIVARSPSVGGDYVRDVLVVAAFAVGGLVLGAATLRRRTA